MLTVLRVLRIIIKLKKSGSCIRGVLLLKTMIWRLTFSGCKILLTGKNIKSAP